MAVGLQNVFHPRKAWAAPLHAQVEVTTHCNLRCAMCSHPTMVEKPQHMTFEEFVRVCQILQPVKVSMSGIGEPFMNPDMTKMIRYATGLGIKTITTSNLTVMSPPLAEEIVASGLGLIKGSIDSANSTTYLAIRGRDLHHKVLESLRNLQEAKNRAGSRLPHVRLQFVMQRANFLEIPDVLDICEEYGVEAVYFQPLDAVNDNYVTSETVENLIGDMDREEFLSALKEAYFKSEHLSVVTNLPQLFRDFNGVWNKYAMENSKDLSLPVCLMPWSSLYVSVEGDVRLCCVFASSPEENLGNLFSEDFPHIWNGRRYQDYRKTFASRKRPNKICQNCLAPTLLGQLKSVRRSKFMIS